MKRLLTAALLCVSALYSATAQSNLTGLNEIGGTPLNKSIPGDFNGDGLTDFVFVANSSRGQLQLTTYLGRGDGFITSIKNSFLSINSSWNIFLNPGAAADFNGDGKQDIAFWAFQTSTNSAILLIAYGNGDGTFGTPQQVNTSQTPNSSSLFVLDLNNDHKPDLLFNSGSNIVAMLGNGDGTFQAPVITASSSLPSTSIVAINDLNGDGFPDLLVTGANNSYYVALGNGLGGFTSTGTPIDLGPTVQPSSSLQQVSAGPIGMQDFNQDKKVDMLFLVTVTNFGVFTVNNTLLFIPGNGDGTFGTAQQGGFLSGTDPVTGNPIDYTGTSGDFYQDGNYEGLIVGSTDPCCDASLVTVDANGNISTLGLSSYSSDVDIDNNQISPQQFSSYTPLTFGPHQAGFVDGTGMLFMFASYSQASVIYLPTYFLSFATSPSTPVSSTLQFSGSSGFVASSVTAPPPLSISNLNIAPNNCCSANVTFTPSQSGPFSSIVSINSNDSVSPLNIPVFAYAGTSAFTVSPTSINFEYVKTGTTSSQQVTVTNTSGSPAYVTQVSLLGNPQTSQTNNCTGPITSTCSITATFAPTTVTSGTGTLSITDQNGLTTTASLTSSSYSTGPVLTLGTSSLNFPDQNVGTTATESLQLSNTGDQPLTIQSMTTAAPFSVTTPCTAIPVGGNCQASISFKPTATGESSQTLTITSNAVNSPQTIPLTGTGVTPSFSATPTSLSFGYQKVGVASAAQQITLKNTSSQAMTIANIAIAPPFAQTNTCGGTIASGATCTISVTATPTATGVQNQALQIIDQNNGSTAVALSVTGYSAGPILNYGMNGSLSFGNQLVSTTSSAQSLTLQNIGDAPAQIQPITISGEFAESTTCGSTIQPGASCAIKVTFTPTSIGNQSGTLTIAGNFPNSPLTFALSGTGTAVQLQITPASVDLGSEFVGVTGLPKTVTLSNTGNLPVTVQSINTTGPFGSLNACGSIIQPGDACAIGIFFQPTAVGSQTGTLAITDNAPGSPQQIQLSGTGSSINVAASSGSSTSATIQQGGTATYNLTVKAEDGFVGNLAVGCDDVPSGIQCTPNPTSVALTTSASNANVIFTVGPVTKSSLTPYARVERLASLALLFGIFSAGFRRKHRQLHRYVAVALICGLSFVLSACGGGSSASTSQSGNPGGTSQSSYILQATFTTSTGEKMQVPLNLTIKNE